MRKKILVLLFVLFSFFVHSQELPQIQLPNILLDIEDKRQFVSNFELDQQEAIPQVLVDTIDKPDFSEAIKIDLEETLPTRTDSDDKSDPVDAIIKFGYGLNNNMLADFSIFVKSINPQVSIHYIRKARESMFVDKPDEKYGSSLDDLQAQILYSNNKFSLGSEVGFYQKTHSLQDKSIYGDLTKRVLNVDVGPSLKFNNNNDLTLRVFNSFLFFDSVGDVDKKLFRNDFAYLLQSDLVYSQVLGNNHFITTHAGYDFNYDQNKIKNGNTMDVSSDFDNVFFNNIKTGISYSTLLYECFMIKASVEFLGTFRDTEFFWYIVPNIHLGYNYLDYFNCYVEGGANLIKKPDQYWYKEHDYVVYPQKATPGYKWYAQTGLKGTVTGWFSGTTDLEFAYNMGGLDWQLTNKAENLYSVVKRDYMELNLSAGFVFTFKQYLEITTKWKHSFLDKSFFSAQDSLTCEIKATVPVAGLTFGTTFVGGFVRKDIDGNDLGNIYLLNASIDWDYKQRFGLGVQVNNMLYFQQYQLMKGYDEAGIEFIIYMKIGF